MNKIYVKALVITILFYSCTSTQVSNTAMKEEARKDKLSSLSTSQKLQLASRPNVQEITLQLLAEVSYDSTKSWDDIEQAIILNPNTSLETIGMIYKRDKERYYSYNKNKNVQEAIAYCKNPDAKTDSLFMLAQYGIKLIDKEIVNHPNASFEALVSIYNNHRVYIDRHPFEKEFAYHRAVNETYRIALTSDNTDSLLFIARLGIETFDWALVSNPNANGVILEKIIQDLFENRKYENKEVLLLNLYLNLLMHKNTPESVLEKANLNWLKGGDRFSRETKTFLINEIVASHENTSLKKLDELAHDEDDNTSPSVAINKKTSTEILDYLIHRHTKDFYLQEQVAKHNHVSLEMLEYLSITDDVHVLNAIYKNKLATSSLKDSVKNKMLRLGYNPGEVEMPTIYELLENNKISIRVYPEGIKNMELDVTAKNGRLPAFVIPAGTWFGANDDQVQNMISIRDVIVNPAFQSHILVNVPVACANHSLEIPSFGDGFLVKGHTENEDLANLIKTSTAYFFPYEVMQSAIWIVTDDLTFDEITALNENGRSIIGIDDIRQAVKLVNESGMDVRKKKIWNYALHMYNHTYRNGTRVYPMDVFIRKWYRDQGVIDLYPFRERYVYSRKYRF